MHFVIIGGAGFIGSHLTEQLLSEGYNVTVVDNLSTGRVQNLLDHPRLRLIQKNVMHCITEDFDRPVHGIVHLAATPSVTESWLSPLETHHNNLSAIIAVLQLCELLNVPRLVFASSAAVYGDQISHPIQESQPTHPISPYGLQKLVSEQYAKLFAKRLGLSFVALRLFNVFGPRQLTSSPYSGVISIFVDRMQRNLPITIYGDGSQTRDFIYVKDVVCAFIQALTCRLAPGSCLTCNIGIGQSISLVQLVALLKTCFPQWHLPVNFEPSRPGDIQHSRADISQAISCLAFSPQWSVQAGLQCLVSSSINDRVA